MELSSTFSGCTLQQAACFLRLIYSPNHATLAGLGALHQADAALLPALTRLAHRLDAGTLLAKLEACLQGACRAWVAALRRGLACSSAMMPFEV